jgi:hypothetical protein
MRKTYRVARMSANKVRWEDCVDLPEEWADRITNSCVKRKDGYALDENVLAELLDLHAGETVRFALLALLVDVRKGRKIVLFV